VKRRAFLCGSAAVLAAPLGAKAQQVRTVPRIGFITTASPEEPRSADSFRAGLRDLGYSEGRNINH
jgi:putative ABC transport system substrate-binding protein